MRTTCRRWLLIIDGGWTPWVSDDDDRVVVIETTLSFHASTVLYTIVEDVFNRKCNVVLVWESSVTIQCLRNSAHGLFFFIFRVNIDTGGRISLCLQHSACCHRYKLRSTGSYATANVPFLKMFRYLLRVHAIPNVFKQVSHSHATFDTMVACWLHRYLKYSWFFLFASSTGEWRIVLVASGNSRFGLVGVESFALGMRMVRSKATTRLPGMCVHVLSVCAKEAVCVMCGSVRQVVGVTAVRGGRSAWMYSVYVCMC